MNIFLSNITIFVYNVILFLILTIIIAVITLIERKLLSIIQRRVGPNYIGYKGRLQFIADALKLLMKQIVVLTKINKLLFLILPALVLIVCYLF
jgi:NADH:ubiquinone oxidoreductase subunit H